MNLDLSIYRYIKRIMHICILLIFFVNYAQCPQNIVFPASSGAVATTTINGNGYKLGNAILTLSNTSIVSFTNTIENGHQSAYGIEIAHSGAADSFTDRVETQLSFSQPVYSLSFNLNDIDAGDRVRIQAFDQNNTPITLATGNFVVGSAVTSGTAPNWEFSSGNTNIASSDSNTTARIAVNFNNRYVTRIVLQYYDDNSNGSYTIANLTGQVLCANPDIFSNVKGNFTTPTVISNDFHLAAVATVSNVSASAVGTWPSGIIINSNGTVSVANTVAAGVYTLTYQICSTSTTANCSSSTISLTILEDTDGDGIADINDQDDDNDGILDTDEGFCESTSVYTMNGTSSVANANTSFGVNGNTFNLVYSLTSGPAVAGLGTSFNVPFTYSDFNNTATAVNHTWESALSSSGTNVAILPNTSTLYTSLPTNNTTNESTSGASADASDVGFRFLLATGAINQLGTFTSSIGNLPVVSGQLSSFVSSDLRFTSVHNYEFQGSPLNRRLWFSGYYARPVDLIAEESVVNTRTVIFPVNFGSTQNWLYTAFDNAVAGNATNGGARGLITITANSVTYCNHRDTDGDGIPNYLDLDSDNDGCPDAREGAGNYNPSTTASGSLATQNPNINFGTAVNSTTGIPTAVGAGQGIGQSTDASKNDCLDSDGDTIPDWEDLDDDNDGVLDTVECPTYITTPNIIANSATELFNFNVNTLAKTSICTGGLSNLLDIAVSPSGIMYGVVFVSTGVSSLVTINQSNCTTTTVIANMPFSSNSLSFLPDGNLLLGGGSGNSLIRKIDIAGGTNAISVWRNYGSGNSNGDFIYINGKVYVLWFDTTINATNPVIREVTIDSNYNYVSETILGPVQRFAFGLAKANGNQLYAVTAIGNDGGSNPPGTIIKINLNPFSWNVISNYPEGLLGATSSEEGLIECDMDGDGIPNRLDLDSDGDGCTDAIEGGAAFNTSNLATSSMLGGNSGTNYNGLSANPVIQNLGNTVDTTPTTLGVPTIAGTGQTIGQSQNGFKNDCQDFDVDGIADWQDVDDDNDGMLDAIECTTTVNDFITAFGGGLTTDIVPSDFGLALNAKNQNVTRDLSSKFGYPANSGAVIVSITNASVHPSANVWWTKNGELPSIWKVTGNVSAFLGMGYDPQYYASDSKTFHIYDNADVIPVTVPGLANQTPVAGQWSVTDNQSQKTLRNLDTNSGTLESGNWRYINMNFGPKSLGFSTTVASADPNYSVTMLLECDTDKDGIPDRLDLDSDADNCSDALEAGADILSSQLVTAAGNLSGGSTSVNQNICALTTCVSTTGTNIGLPQFSTLPTGYSNTTGQTIGSSQNALVSSCVCYEDPTLVVGQTYPVKHGITVLGRAGADNGNWPMIRNSAYTALESKTKGFVITRMTSDPLQAAAANHLNKIINPVVGMMVFDVFADVGKGCLKIYTGSGAGEGWKCFNSQTCP